MDSIERGLQIAHGADLHEATGRAYCNLQSVGTILNRFESSERYYSQGMTYCEGLEFGVFTACLNGGRAYTLLLQGRWDEAADICGQMLGRRRISPVNRLNPLRVLGSIRGRRGEAGAWELLDEVLALAEATGEPQWIVPVRTVRAELRWLSGQPDLAVREARPACDQALGHVDPWTLGSVVIWLSRLHVPASLPAGLPEPFAREMAGDWRGAAAAWDRLGRSYDAAGPAVVLGRGRAPASPDDARRPRRPGGRRRGQAADEGTRSEGDTARAPARDARRSGRADCPRAGGSRAALGGPAGPGDRPAAVHFRADGAPPRLRGLVQDRRLVPDGSGPRGCPDGHRNPGLARFRANGRPDQGLAGAQSWAPTANANLGTRPAKPRYLAG
jgi:hypothetical protein